MIYPHKMYTLQITFIYTNYIGITRVVENRLYHLTDVKESRLIFNKIQIV